MPLYETVLIARNELTQAQVEAVADQVAGIIAETGGEIRKREYWGLRGLAYKIKKNRKAHYMLLGMDCVPTAEKEVARQLGLNEDVLRHMTLRIEAIDVEAAILAKRGDDRERDRGFRGPRPAGRFGSGRGRERGDDREEYRARSHDEPNGGEE